jgi:hypothetical protein
MYNDEPPIKSIRPWMGLFLAPFCAFMFFLSAQFIRDSLSEVYLQLIPFISGLVMAAVGLIFVWQMLLLRSFSVYTDRLEITNVLSRKTEVIYYDTIRYWTEKEQKDRSGKYKVLTIWTDTRHFGLSGQGFADYNEVKQIITRAIPEGKNEEARIKAIEQRNGGFILLGFSLLPLLAILYLLGQRTADIRPTELSPVSGTLAKNLKVDISGKHNDIYQVYLHLVEYPGFTFRVSNGAGYKSIYPSAHQLIMDVMKGDSITLNIFTDVAKRKLSNELPLRFFDKTLEYRFIDVYGIKHNNISYFNLETYNIIHRGSDQSTGYIIAIIAFFALLSGGIWQIWKGTAAVNAIT